MAKARCNRWTLGRRRASFQTVNDKGGDFPLRRIIAAGSLCLLALGIAASAGADPLPDDLLARASSGDAAATSTLAVWLYDRDNPAALPWLNKAAAGGDTEAMYALGKARRDGQLGLAADWNGGMSLLQQAALKGNGDAVFELNTCCATGGGPVYDAPKSGLERLRWALRMNERMGDGRFDTEIANLARAGHGADIPAWRSEYLADLQAAKDGDARAAETVARRYLSGEGVRPDLAQAEWWFQRVADDGEYYHQLITARNYESGTLGDQRRGMAIIYYTRAADSVRTRAEEGDRDAQVQLARLYDQNKLGAEDTAAKAYHWYSRAAASGDVEAQGATGRALLGGRGVAQDTAAGLMWLTRAANNNGHRLSNAANAKAVAAYQLELAGLYTSGTLIPADPAKADYWLELGLDNMWDENSSNADRLNSEAADIQAVVRRSLSADQISETERTTRIWHGQHETPAFAQK